MKRTALHLAALVLMALCSVSCSLNTEPPPYPPAPDGESLASNNPPLPVSELSKVEPYSAGIHCLTMRLKGTPNTKAYIPDTKTYLVTSGGGITPYGWPCP